MEPLPKQDIPHEKLAIRYRADYGITGDNGEIERWADLSGNGVDALHTTGGKPVLVHNAINGCPSIRFSVERQTQLDFQFDPNGLTGMTIALVSANSTCQVTRFGVENSVKNHGTLCSPLSWQEAGFWGLVYLTPLQRTVSVRFGSGQAYNTHIYQRLKPIENSFTCTVAVHNENAECLYIDGEEVMSWGVVNPVIANIKAVGWLGRGRANTWFEGDIAEVIVYARALENEDLQDLLRYLQGRYGYHV